MNLNQQATDEKVEPTVVDEATRDIRAFTTSVPPKRNPLETTNWFFVLTFDWLTPLLFKGLRRPLEVEDIWDLRKTEKAENCHQALGAEIVKNQNSKHPFWAAIFSFMKVYGLRFWFAGFLLLISIALNSANPTFLRYFLEAIMDPRKPEWHGYVWAATIGVCQFLAVGFMQYFMYNSQIVAVQLKSALYALVYRKAIKLSNRSRVQKTNGEIVNLMSIDVQKLSDLTIFIHLGWAGIIQIGVSIGMLVDLIGWATFVGLGVMVLTIPFFGVLIRFWTKFRIKNLKLSDSRMKIITEILQGISIIKFFNWENNYANNVKKVRKQEVYSLIGQTVVKCCLLAIMFTLPAFVSVATFGVYSATGNELHSPIVFSSIAYFNQIRFPLISLLMVIQFAVEGSVSINRLNVLFHFEDAKPLELGTKEGTDYAVKLDKCNFEWDEKPKDKTDDDKKKKKKKKQQTKQNEETVIELETVSSKEKDTKTQEKSETTVGKLTDINVEIKHGELVMIVGRVGSGKSSLLNGIIGEMRKTAGTVEINGSVAYCAQQAWIQNATLRDNITFGKPFNKEKYDEIIKICCLTKDLEILKYGDMTEIGEKGINLSGGQRQRVSLARAVYQDSDIYLFDDPLSALDAHIGKQIFTECITKHLKDKTRVLVTHQLQYLRFASKIIVIDDGKIIETGTYDELVNKKDGHLQRLLEEYTAKESKDDKQEKTEKKLLEEESKDGLQNNLSDEERKRLARLMKDEERARGSISLKVIWDYCSYGGGIFAIILILLAYGVSQATTTFSDYWVGYWTDKSIPAMNEWIFPWSYIIVYCGIGIAQGVFNFIKTFVSSLILLVIGNRIFSASFSRILRSPKWFFDTTPVGRFLSRFSKDQEMLDNTLPMYVQQTLASACAIIAVIVVITRSSPWFLCAAVPLMIIYILIQQMYSKSSREIKRIEAIIRSPVYAHLSESLNGIPTIRAYKVEEQFIRQNEKLVNGNLRAWFVQWMLQRWLGLRLETIGAAIILAAGLFMAAGRGKIDPGIIGVTMTYAMQVSFSLNQFVTQMTEAEIQFNAAERLIYYTTTPNEPTAISKPENEPEPDWPQKGEIVFDNYKMRYREGLDLVLKGLNCKIKPQEKIGIVGRTGAGKSSMILALFRMMEAAEGSISIDGWKISDVNLATLRQRLSIIPQEPVLFTGTVRSNLDPFNQYDDNHLWQVLEKAHLKEAIAKHEKKLETPVVEGGENFSVGERQLLCLARALCKKSKILLIDEATANVDLETDALIQKTIDKEFSDCTRLTIAHRLNTIMNSDRILVMDNGYVAEFDTPKALLLKKDSIFSMLVDETGPANAKLLRSMVFGEEYNGDQTKEETPSSQVTTTEQNETPNNTEEKVEQCDDIQIELDTKQEENQKPKDDSDTPDVSKAMNSTETSTKQESSEKSEKSEHQDNAEKQETPEKQEDSEKHENKESLEKQETSENSEKPENSEKQENSDTQK